MDFIEQLFGLSPDGGNGAFEILLFFVPMAIAAALWFSHAIKRKT